MTLVSQMVFLINQAKVTQKARFILLLIICVTGLVDSITTLIAIRQIPALLEWIIQEALKIP